MRAPVQIVRTESGVCGVPHLKLSPNDDTATSESSGSDSGEKEWHVWCSPLYLLMRIQLLVRIPVQIMGRENSMSTAPHCKVSPGLCVQISQCE